jgi:hypothetical protein
VRDRQLGGRVCEVDAPDIGVCSYFVEGGAQARRYYCFKKVGDAIQLEVVVVIVFCTCGTWVGTMVPNDLEAR